MPRVYVGNLAASVTSHDLRTHFARAGEVRSAMVVCDKVSGECRGFGVVVMEDSAHAEIAFSLLNDTKLNGQRITIDLGTAHTSGRTGARSKGH